ncbi:hypothetical protein ZHAS_00003218 [Anopheles sinensis]|uniref:Uncharacterized protein n=1 Tax=Anopheles sinensis TaxID=74873 RepID=A0A084VDW4_ANOSI|nr:hypothetical protein ZHAS_00003218 [Anopheles sinensis]
MWHRCIYPQQQHPMTSPTERKRELDSKPSEGTPMVLKFTVQQNRRHSPTNQPTKTGRSRTGRQAEICFGFRSFRPATIGNPTFNGLVVAVIDTGTQAGSRTKPCARRRKDSGRPIDRTRTLCHGTRTFAFFVATTFRFPPHPQIESQRRPRPHPLPLHSRTA